MVKAKIELICDGNPRIGMGHVVRSIEIARKLKEAGFGVAVQALSSIGKELIRKYGMNEMLECKPHIRIIDLPGNTKKYIQESRALGIVCVGLDCFEATPDVNVAIYEHTEIDAASQTYVGFDYVIIRDEIRRSKLGSRISTRIDDIVISLGAADIKNESKTVARILSLSNVNVKLIIGPLSKDNYAIPQDACDMYTTYRAPLNFGQLLAETDFVVSNCGTTMFESMYLGKPVFVLPQTKMEQGLADWLKSERYISGNSLNDIYIPLPDQAKFLSERGEKLIDGRGVDRIVKIIGGLI